MTAKRSHDPPDDRTDPIRSGEPGDKDKINLTPPPPLAPDSWQSLGMGAAAGADNAQTDPVLETRGSSGATDADALPQIPGYEVLDVLGRGGMAIVYRARQFSLKRTVALKMILPGRHLDRQQMTRFQGEAQAVSQLEHPNIVPIYEIGSLAGCPFFTTELLQGGSLADALGGKPQRPRFCAEMVQLIAKAVHFTHQHGIVHRDLKPANVLLSGDGVPKIGDFGLAKHLETEEGLTHSGAVMGTPSYMAPEQAEGRSSDVGPAADIYALGGILYQMLTGRPPFLAESSVDTLVQVIHQEPVPPRRLNPSVPRDLETITLKCLRKEPPARYASAESVALDLERYLRHQPIAARPVGPLERSWRWCRRRPLVAGLLLALCLTLIGGLTGIMNQSRRANREAGVARREQARALRSEAAKWDSLYVTRINLAWHAWQKGRLLRMRDQLQRQIPAPGSDETDLRGFEWYFLSDLSQSSGWRTLPEHAGPVRSVAFAPDGNTLASSSEDGSVTLWQVQSGQQLGHWSHDQLTSGAPSAEDDANQRAAGAPAMVAYSADGRWLAVACGRNIRILNVAENRLQPYTLRGKTEIRSLAVSPRDNLLASSDQAGRVSIWHLPDGEERAHIQAETGGLHSVPCLPIAFSPKTRDLVIGSPSGMLSLWNTGTGQTRALPINQPVTSIAFSPDGRYIALAPIGRDGTVVLWDHETSSVRAELDGHNDQVNMLAFSSNGKTLATVSADHTAKRWQVETTRLLSTYRAHSAAVHALALSPDGRFLATGSEDRTVLIWKTEPQHEFETRTTPHDGTRYNDLRFTPSGDRLVAGGYCLGDRPEPLLELFDPQAMSPPVTLQGPPRGVITLAASPDGQTLVTGEARFGDLTSPGLFRLWDLETKRVRAELRGHQSYVCSASFSPSGELLATGCGDMNNIRPGEAKIWRVSTGQLVTSLPPHRGAVLVAFARGGAELLTAAVEVSGVTQLRRWDPKTGELLAVFPGGLMHLTALAVTPDGNRLATSHIGPDGRLPVKIWKLPEGELVDELSGVSSVSNWLCFSDDAGQLAAGGFDGSVTTWEMEERTVQLQIPGSGDLLSMLTFSPDGKTLTGVMMNPSVSAQPRPSAAVCWNTSSGERLRQTFFPVSHALCVDYIGQGSRLVVGTASGSLVVCSASSLQKEHELQPGAQAMGEVGHQAAITCVAVSAAGDTLATGAEEGSVRLWQLPSGELVGSLPTGGQPLSSVEFLPDGKLLAAATSTREVEPGGRLTLWDYVKRRPHRVIPLGDMTPTRLVFGKNRSLWVIGNGGNATGDGQLFVFDAATGEVRNRFDHQRFGPGCVAVSADGSLAVFPEDDFDISLWTSDTGHLARRFRGHEDSITCMVFSPDQKSLFTGSRDQTVRIWHVATGEELLALPHPDAVDAVAISSNGRTLASASRQEGRAMIRLWRAPQR